MLGVSGNIYWVFVGVLCTHWWNFLTRVHKILSRHNNQIRKLPDQTDIAHRNKSCGTMKVRGAKDPSQVCVAIPVGSFALENPVNFYRYFVQCSIEYNR